MRRKRLLAALVAAAVLPITIFSADNAVPAFASADGTAAPASTVTPSAAPAKTPGPVRLADPSKMLPGGWQHSSDEAVTVVGDGTGLHVLAASEASGYSWQSVATLGKPAVQTDLWIGQACMTASGNTAVVVYAPEQVTNTAEAQGVLGRAAVVNLHTGAVKELGGGFSVAYFNPGCGAGNTAVLTEGGWADDTSRAPASTTLATVNTSAGTITSTVRVPGQITSAVPYDGRIAAAGGKGLEEISSTGKTSLLTETATVPYQLAPDASGNLGYQTVSGHQVHVWNLAAGRAHEVASAAVGTVELRQTGGRVTLIGPAASKLHGLPAQWTAVDAPATAQPSSTGALVVDSASSVAPAKGQKTQPDAPQPVGIHAQLLGGSRQGATFEIPTTAARIPAATGTAAPGTRASHATAATAGGSPSSPVSDDRTCGIPLNDPHVQAYQPTFQQVEWAADQAVQGTLTNARPAGLYGSSLTSYTPQGMFPLPAVAGGGTLPAQVLLGVMTQESNLRQASQHVVQGQTSNPLTSFNWYGNWINGETTDTGMVNWTASDCGYGIAQITSGMCQALGQNSDPECEYQAPMSSQEQTAVAVDYQANIAAGAQMLINDWNELWNDGIKPNNLNPATNSATNDSTYVDNWYMTLWAYNSGLEPGTAGLGNSTGCTPGPTCTDGDGNWGLGYADNPINPAYPPDRPTFATSGANAAPGGASYSAAWDESHPQYWPYQDKVLGWAFDAVTLYDYSKGADVQAFAWAKGTYQAPPIDLWCTSQNSCVAAGVDTTQPTGLDSCVLQSIYVDHCWWHVAPQDTWSIQVPTSSCSACGLQQLTYAAGAQDPGAEPIAGHFAQSCTEYPLPANAVIVGDGGQAALGCPGQNWTSAGSMSWNFAPDSNGNYSSKIDFDQIGAGFGGHFWFGYTTPNNAASEASIVPAPGTQNQAITGTWTPPSSVTGWTDVQVAIPSYGANATDANYKVSPGGGLPTRNVQINQSATSGTNTWVDLGDFYLGSGAHVSLSNVTPDLNNGVDIAWDAAAFIAVSNPQVNYVAMGDSFSSGEGVTPYFSDSDTSTDTCHRSEEAYPMLVTLPGQTTPIAQQTSDGFSFIACSGAETTGISNASVNPVGTTTGGNNSYPAQENAWNEAGNTDWGYQQYTAPWNNTGGPVEGLQDNNSALNPKTALITMSIGGNDIRFADVIKGCLIAAAPLKTNCSASTYTLTRGSNGSTDPAPLVQFEPTVISYLEAHLVETYLAISNGSPSADIVAVGYPYEYPANPTSPCNSGTWLGTATKLSVSDQTMLNNFGDELDTAISQAVAQVKADGVDIQYVNPQPAFVGHALCDSSPWLIAPSLTTQVAGFFHPNQTGQAEYATLINQCLAGKLSC
jgi:hypothetical protein